MAPCCAGASGLALRAAAMSTPRMGRQAAHQASPGWRASPDLHRTSISSLAQDRQQCAKRVAALLRLRAAPATPPASSLSEWYATLYVATASGICHLWPSGVSRFLQPIAKW
eukprot:4704902-Lingulodinium_polyedra.AAC.1